MMSTLRKLNDSLYNPTIRNVLFVLFILITFIILYGSEIPFLRPQSVHQWRQSDSASYALNYYQKGLGFFHPQTMNMRGDNCEMVSEFPIIYYITSKFYTWFGFHEVFLRLISYLFFALGLHFLFKLSLSLFNNRVIISFIPLVFILSAPYISYYALNFLPNVPALGMAFASWYFYFKWWEKEKSHFLWLGMSFMMLGMLLKPIVGISMIAFILTSIFKYYGWFGLNPFSRKSKRMLELTISTLIVSAINIAWISFAKSYNLASGYRHHLLGILPMWDMDKESIMATFKILKTKWGYQLYYPPVFALILLGIVSMSVLWRKIYRPLFICTILLFLGQIIYLILYFKTFYHHDYYLINVIVAPLFVLLSNLNALTNMKKHNWVRIALGVFLTLTVFMSFKHSRHIIQERYFGSLWEGVNKDVETVEPYLRSIGIDRSDLVVSVPDPSPNISLYMMNQQGWTEIFNTEGYEMSDFVEQGAKYLIINDPAYFAKEPYKQYIYNKVGQYKSISVFKLD